MLANSDLLLSRFRLLFSLFLSASKDKSRFRRFSYKHLLLAHAELGPLKRRVKTTDGEVCL